MIKRSVILLAALIFHVVMLRAQEVQSNTSHVIQLDYPASLADLTKDFKGKVVYIDLMASWCKPCIAEFEHAKKMNDYFKQHNIVKLYITIDNPESIQKAYDLLNTHALDGYFVSYHNPVAKTGQNDYTSFVNDLFQAIDEHGNVKISIPAYAILDREGKLVESKAQRPSSPDKLKEQLQQYL